MMGEAPLNWRGRLKDKALDVLFVNAGVSGEWNQPIAEVSTAEFERVVVANSLSAMRAWCGGVPRSSVPAPMASSA